MKKLFTLLAALWLSMTLTAQDTFSIIAVDPATGEVGSAGATCVDGIAQFGGLIDVITDIIPGRGGVNSQAWVCIPNINLQNAITRMEAGDSPSEIITWLVNNDACNSQNFNPEFRQYGIADLDPQGNPRTAGWTGSMADDFKDDIQGATYSVQGNILLDNTILTAMENNFNNTSGTLADKLMAAMQGANVPGADSRCLARGTSSTSAYLLVYKSDDEPGDPYLRLNIEEMPFGEEPIDSLQVLYDNFLAVADVPFAEKVRLFPNPVSEELILAYDASVTIKSLSVYDIQGKKLLAQSEFEGQGLQERINVSELPSGVYFLKIDSPQGTASLKFVKQ